MFALVPILPQAVNLGLGDRTEVRARFDKYTGLAEASTTPFAAVSAATARESLTLRYSPSFTLTTVDAQQGRQLIVYHTASLVGVLHMRHTTFTLSETADYGERNFLIDALGAPNQNAPPPTNNGLGPAVPTPNPNPGANPAPNAGMGAAAGTVANPAIPARGGTVRYGDLITQATVAHPLTRRSTVGGYARYMLAGGVDAPSREFYPIIRTPSVGAFYGYQLSKRAALATIANAAYSTSSLHIQTYTADLSEGFRYAFSPNFGITFAVGVGYARVQYADNTVLEYVYLTAGGGTGVGVEYSTRLSGGILTLSARASYAPALDQVRAVLDPRIGWGLGATWVRKPALLYAGVSSTISLRSSSDRGTLDAITGAVGGSYVLGHGFAVDAGARAIWQTFEGNQTIPVTYVVFVGLTWGANVPLGKH